MKARLETRLADVVEIRVGDELTHRTASALAHAILQRLALSPPAIWLNLEDCKVVDVMGLAVLQQAVARVERSVSVCCVFPSPVVYRSLFDAGLLDSLPTDKRRPSERGCAPVVVDVVAEERRALARTRRLALAPPSWDELALFQRWAADPFLDHLVGSELLGMCRHLGPYHPDFVREALASPTGIVLLVQTEERSAAPGFVRLYNVNLAQGFAFLETVVAQPRGRRAAWGIEATRLACAFAVEALHLRRLETKVYAYNALSMNSLRHNGFVQEGVLRQARQQGGRRWDIHVFGILEDELRREMARHHFGPLGLWDDERAQSWPESPQRSSSAR